MNKSQGFVAKSMRNLPRDKANTISVCIGHITSHMWLLSMHVCKRSYESRQVILTKVKNHLHACSYFDTRMDTDLLQIEWTNNKLHVIKRCLLLRTVVCVAGKCWNRTGNDCNKIYGCHKKYNKIVMKILQYLQSTLSSWIRKIKDSESLCIINLHGKPSTTKFNPNIWTRIIAANLNKII